MRGIATGLLAALSLTACVVTEPARGTGPQQPPPAEVNDHRTPEGPQAMPSLICEGNDDAQFQDVVIEGDVEVRGNCNVVLTNVQVAGSIIVHGNGGVTLNGGSVGRDIAVHGNGEVRLNGTDFRGGVERHGNGDVIIN